ncbi:MAG: malate/lactate/ureidoglycolate dehydrogenase [Burkholderiaceae bacterium]
MKEHLVGTDALHAWTIEIWEKAGSSSEEARLTADHLVGANLAGHDSHGVGMVPRYVKSWRGQSLQLNRQIEIAVDTGAMVVADGGMGMGQSVAYQAMSVGIERAKEHGVALLGLKHSHHLGRVGHWAEMAVEQGLVSIHFTNALNDAPMVAPHGGSQPRFLTNPFTVGIPRADAEPVILDFATSAIAHGKARVAMNKGVPVPVGSTIDADGQPTTDARVLFHEPLGAIKTFGAHKGHALAMVVEMLGAAMVGGKTTHPANYPKGMGIMNNMMTIVFDPARLETDAAFQSETKSFVDWVQSTRLDSVGEELGGVLLPGDPERRMRIARAKQIPIDEGTMGELVQAAETVSEARGKEVTDPTTLIVG